FKTTEVVITKSEGRGQPPRGQLRIVFPTELEATIPVAGGRTVLGRLPDDERTLPILHSTVSRTHLAIEWDGGQRLYTGVDLGSRNGSQIDGASAADPLPLRTGSVVRIGSVLLIFEADEALDAQDAPGVSREAVPGDAAATRALRAAMLRAARDPSPLLLMG